MRGFVSLSFFFTVLASLHPLTCTFLNFTVFVNELTVSLRPFHHRFPIFYCFGQQVDDILASRPFALPSSCIGLYLFSQKRRKNSYQTGPLDFRLVVRVLLSPLMLLNACECRLHPCLTSLAEDGVLSRDHVGWWRLNQGRGEDAWKSQWSGWRLKGICNIENKSYVKVMQSSSTTLSIL